MHLIGYSACYTGQSACCLNLCGYLQGQKKVRVFDDSGRSSFAVVACRADFVHV